MKIAKNRLIFLCLLIIGSSVLVSFQNCGGPAGEEVDQDSKELASMKDAPFAYDTSLNELSYLSCVQGRAGHSLDPSIFYSIKAGAFKKSDPKERSGLRLSNDFISFVDSKYLNYYSGGQADPEKTAKALDNSEMNKGARAQLTIRPRNNLQSEILSINNNSDEGNNNSYLTRSLSSTEIAQQLSKTRDLMISSFDSGATAADKEIVGALRFFDNEDAMQTVRTSLHNSYILTLTYTYDFAEVQGTDQFLARSPAGESGKNGGKVYGRGFLPHFKAADSAGTVVLPLRVLDTVDEVLLSEDLSRKTSGVTWNCDPKYRYKIIALKDRTKSCPAPGTLTDAQTAEYEVVKKHLRPEAWDINVQLKCAVPRQGSCYDESVPVLYTLPSEPGWASIPAEQRDCGPTKARDCVHFFSLCTRVNANQ